MNVMTSISLYGTVYDIHDFIHHHKWQFMNSNFFMEVNPGNEWYSFLSRQHCSTWSFGFFQQKMSSSAISLHFPMVPRLRRTTRTSSIFAFWIRRNLILTSEVQICILSNCSLRSLRLNCIFNCDLPIFGYHHSFSSDNLYMDWKFLYFSIFENMSHYFSNDRNNFSQFQLPTV